jgi:hypothetical protein
MSAEQFDTNKKAKPLRPRYRTAGDIEKKVDKAHEKAAKFAVLAEIAEAKSKQLYMAGDKNGGGFHKAEAERFWRQHDYQIEKRLPKLKDRMAAIQTLTMPFMGEDRSVSA